jgi:hypothetical protein
MRDVVVARAYVEIANESSRAVSLGQLARE